MPWLYRDLEDALFEVTGDRVEVPDILRYHSWIGGDRDGIDSDESHLVDRLFDFNFSGKEALKGVGDKEGDFADEDQNLLDWPGDRAEQCVHTQ